MGCKTKEQQQIEEVHKHKVEVKLELILRWWSLEKFDAKEVVVDSLVF